VDNRHEIREFLTSRRARITPERAGIPAYGSRRVAGLRRGEVAALAGVSVEYYTRLERGNLSGVSGSVLDALSRALQLDDTERAHLEDLAGTANQTTAARARRRPAQNQVRPSVQHLLTAMTGTPALVRNSRFDILAANSLGRALYSPMFTATPEPVNTARFTFLDHRAPAFFRDWERVARDAVGALRVEAGRNPYDRDLSSLIGELSTRSDQFRMWWGAHDVYVHRFVTKRFRHPVVGDLELAAESMPLTGDTGQTLVAYSGAPGSPADDSLKLLASWAASADAASSPGR
jgi:transcriptional regulator with XRE-family HTH domain